MPWYLIWLVFDCLQKSVYFRFLRNWWTAIPCNLWRFLYSSEDLLLRSCLLTKWFAVEWQLCQNCKIHHHKIHPPHEGTMTWMTHDTLSPRHCCCCFLPLTVTQRQETFLHLEEDLLQSEGRLKLKNGKGNRSTGGMNWSEHEAGQLT